MLFDNLSLVKTTQLASAVDDTQTSFTVLSAAEFISIAPGETCVAVISPSRNLADLATAEHVRFTAVAGNVYTVVRDILGNGATAHAAGEYVLGFWSPAHLLKIQGYLQDIEDGVHVLDKIQIASASPNISIKATGANIPELLISNFGSGISKIQAKTTTGICQLWFEALVTDGVSASDIRFFRETNTSGVRSLILYKGDGSTTQTIIMRPDTGALSITGALSYGLDLKWRQWIPAKSFEAVAAGPVLAPITIRTTSCVVPAWALDKDGNESLCATIPLPPGYDGRSLKFTYFWTAIAGTAGAVKFRVIAGSFANDENMDVALNVQDVTDTFLALEDLHICTTAGAVPVGDIGNLLTVVLFRYGTDAADTFDADVQLLGVLVEFT